MVNELDIFSAALERQLPAERARYLDEACGENRDLRQRIDELLAAHAQSGSFMDAPASDRVLPATMDESIPEAPGTMIGPYKLLEPIGEGGFGIVFMAEQMQPVRRKVALKILKPGMDTRQVVARFEAERQALAIMDHPNIAKVLDGGATPSGRPYFVMELVKGVSITDFCDQNCLTPRQRLELFIPVCQAVQHAHHKGIIHRDLKPSNVLVAVHDTTPVVKVIDFGVAKALGQELTDKTLFTGVAQMIGTPLYMSPEQAGQSGLDIDTRSDIYSLGVLLYELLTGTTPFDKERFRRAAYDEMRRIIREEEPPKPSTRLSESKDSLPSISAQRHTEPAKLTKLVRGELDWLVMKALEKDRNRRYETANGFALDVQRYLADEPVQACPPSAGYRLRKFVRRNKARLAVVAGVFLAVTVMAASIGWAVRDRVARVAEIEREESARQAKVERQVRDSLNSARALIAENKLVSARQKLAEARAQLGNDWPMFSNLAAEVEAGEAALDRFQLFLDLIDRAHQAETAPILEPALAAAGADGNAGTLPPTTVGRRPAEAVPFLLQALQLYQVLDRDDWNADLKDGLLAKDQVEQTRRTVYEELLWLADDVVRRQQEHRSERQLSSEAAARQALIYLGIAESTHRPTLALYLLRARCRKTVGEEAASQADRQLADKTPPTMALDHYLRGQAAYDARQLAEGTQAFEAALHLEPTHYWSMMRLGYCLCDLGQGPADWTGAARVFTGCIMKRPDHAHAYDCRARAYQYLRRYEEAVADWCKAIELDPKSAIAWNNRGHVYSNLGQPDKAIADYSKAIELDAKLAIAWNNRGIAHQNLGQPDKAVADYSKAIELDAKYAKAWYNRGIAHQNLGQLDKAVADFSKAIELDPKLATAWNNRGSVYIKLGQPGKAFADFSKAIALDPKFADAWYNRGIAHQNLGQLDKAVADFSKAIDLDPKYAKAWNNRGNAYSNLGQPDKAIADYSKAIELDAKLAIAWNNRGIAHQNLGQPDKAVADYSKAIELDAKYAKAWYNRGIAHQNLGQLDKAVADYSKAIELDPKYAKAWTNRGNAHQNLGQMDKAVADLSKAIELDPKDAKAWYNRGIVHRKLGQLDKAVADYSKAIELDPKYAEAWNNRGFVYDKLGQPDKAVADFSKAIELDPKHAIAWNNRGNAYSKLGQPDKAAADFSKVIELVPNDPQFVRLYLNRAQANSQLGRFPQALTDYQTFLKRVPASAQAHNELAWLLATCPDTQLRNPVQAVELAKTAVQLAPKEGGFWRTLGVAQYRAGKWQAAIDALNESMELRQGEDAIDWLFLAMAQQRLGNKDEVRKWYDRVILWLEKNQETLAKDTPRAEELRRFRIEAEEVLELKKK